VIELNVITYISVVFMLDINTFKHLHAIIAKSVSIYSKIECHKKKTTVLKKLSNLTKNLSNKSLDGLVKTYEKDAENEGK
jgi:hypothetical protein